MHDTLDGIRIVHDTHPRAETGVSQPVAKAGEGVGHDKNRKWRMGGEDGVGRDVAYGCHDGDAALAEFAVDVCVGEGRERVAGEGGQKDERDDGVIEGVVLFELCVVRMLWCVFFMGKRT